MSVNGVVVIILLTSIKECAEEERVVALLFLLRQTGAWFLGSRDVCFNFFLPFNHQIQGLFFFSLPHPGIPSPLQNSRSRRIYHSEPPFMYKKKLHPSPCRGDDLVNE